MSYDKNGNIQSLQRNGDFDYDDASGVLQIDKLSYFYDTEKKNQLLKVTDATNSPKGFKDEINDNSNNNNNGNVNDYGYDTYGNMTSDDNKNITGIVYNHLNLPTRINFGTGDKIEYLYGATGQKQAKKVFYNESFVTTDYLDGFQYTDAKLNFFPHAEGYVSVTYCEQCQADNQQRFNYVYQYKDHLGNIRVSYGYDQKYEVLKIIEENHYYPFGLKHTNYNSGKKKYEKDEEEAGKMKLKQVAPTDGWFVANNYKFSGREWQDELSLNMYDLRARQYDPAIARFVAIDPLTDDEDQLDKSNYAYAWNDPIKYNDPDGECPSCFLGALVGAAVDYGEQVATNYVEGKEDPFTNNINLVSIGTAAVAGFVTSGGSAVESLAAKTAVKVGAAVINNTVSIKSSSEGLKSNVEKNIGNVIKNTAIDLAADKLAGKAGEKAGSALSKTALTNAGRLSSTAKTVVKALGQNVTRSTTATVKTGVKIASKVVTKTVESATKAATNTQREKVKDITNN